MGHHTRRQETAYTPDLHTELRYLREEGFSSLLGQDANRTIAHPPHAYVFYNDRNHLNCKSSSRHYSDEEMMKIWAYQRHNNPQSRAWIYAFKMDLTADLPEALAQTGMDFTRLHTVEDLRAAG